MFHRGRYIVEGTKCFRRSDLACVSLGDVVLWEGGKMCQVE